MYVLQNAAVALSAVSALAGLHSEQKSPAFWAAVALTIAFGSLSSVGAQGSALSVEKEWTATLCCGDSIAMAKLNSGNAFRTFASAGVDGKLWCMHQGYSVSLHMLLPVNGTSLPDADACGGCLNRQCRTIRTDPILQNTWLQKCASSAVHAVKEWFRVMACEFSCSHRL